MAKSSEEPKFTLRLVVDEEKNKVVFAEACRDFVDVIFSLLTLPMGNIIRLLEKNQDSQPVAVGCFNNLYKSVVDLGIDDFETEACKQMLMYPRSLNDVQCKRLKLNINPSEDVQLFHCPNFSSCKTCSDFSTCQCRCGKLMSEEIKVSQVKVVQNDANGVFTRGRSSFIITDDLEVTVRSTDFVLRKLKSLGCGDVSKLGEMRVDVGFQKVLTLLQCMFSSNAPLTDTFLNKQSPQVVLKICETVSSSTESKRNEAEPEETIKLSAIVRKHDMRVLYVECGDDLVDLLFTFLAVPLESVLEVSSCNNNKSTFGCIENLFKSFKNLNATEVSTSKAVLPHYYRFQKQLLNIVTDQPPLYCRYKINFSTGAYRLRTNDTECLFSDPVALMDPKSHGSDQSTRGSGFVKRDTKFTVSDDLIITPMNSSSTFCLLKKLQIHAEDLEVQEISISRDEASSLLRASLVTSSALNTCLRSLILKKPKEEI